MLSAKALPVLIAFVVSQTNTQQAQPTGIYTVAATTDRDMESATSHSATFAGVSGGLKSTSSSASSLLAIPAVDVSALLAGCATVFGFCLGSSFVFFC